MLRVGEGPSDYGYGYVPMSSALAWFEESKARRVRLGSGKCWFLACVAQPMTAMQVLTWASANPWILDLPMAGDKERHVGKPGR